MKRPQAGHCRKDLPHIDITDDLLAGTNHVTIGPVFHNEHTPGHGKLEDGVAPSRFLLAVFLAKESTLDELYTRSMSVVR